MIKVGSFVNSVNPAQFAKAFGSGPFEVTSMLPSTGGLQLKGCSPFWFDIRGFVEVVQPSLMAGQWVRHVGEPSASFNTCYGAGPWQIDQVRPDAGLIQLKGSLYWFDQRVFVRTLPGDDTLWHAAVNALRNRRAQATPDSVLDEILDRARATLQVPYPTQGVAAHTGHCTDGSSIQKHSVGDIYPLAVVGYGDADKVQYIVEDLQRGTHLCFSNNRRVVQTTRSATAYQVALSVRCKGLGRNLLGPLSWVEGRPKYDKKSGSLVSPTK